MAKKNEQTFTLPDGTPFIYDTTMSQQDIVEQYNVMREKEGYESLPEMVMGAPPGVRALLSDQPKEIKDATLKKLFGWNQQLTSGFSAEDIEIPEESETFTGKLFDKTIGRAGKAVAGAAKNMVTGAGPFQIYFNEDDNKIYTMDEPFMKGPTKGDFADIAKPAAGIAAELAAVPLTGGASATTSIPARAGNAARRGGIVGPVGAVTEEAYTQGARLFGLEDPRTFGETMRQVGEDAGYRALFETGFNAPLATTAKAAAKKVSRLRGQREAFSDSLDVYRKAFDQDPLTAGIVTGKGSSVRNLEDNAMEYFHEQGGDKVRDAIVDTATVMRNRTDDILSGQTAPGPGAPFTAKGPGASGQMQTNIEPPLAGGFMGETATPAQVGGEMRRDLFGERVPYSRARDRTPGRIAQAEAQKNDAMTKFSNNFPGDTRLYPDNPDYGILGAGGNLPGRPHPGGQGSAAVVVAPGLAGAPQLNRAPQHPRAYRKDQKIPTQEMPEYPLNATADRLMASYSKRTAGAPADLKDASNIINNKDATISELIELRARIGKNGLGLADVAPTDSKQLYAAINDTIEQRINTMPGLGEESRAKLLFEYQNTNRLAEQYYTDVHAGLRKAFTDSTGQEVPAEKFFDTMWNAMGVGQRSGDSQFLNLVFSNMEPEVADYARRGLMTKIFAPNETLQSGIKRWGKISDEVKDIIAPGGQNPSYWRNQIDMYVEADNKLGLTDRVTNQPQRASLLSKEQRSTGRKLRTATGMAVSGGGVSTGLMLLGAGGGPAATVGGAAAGLYFGKELLADVTERAAMRGKTRLVRSPAFMDWAVSVSNSIPDGALTADSAIDFLMTVVPRIGYQANDMSQQDMRDMQELQKIYLDVMKEAVRISEAGAAAEPIEGGILGAGARPPTDDSIFSTTFTDTARR